MSISKFREIMEHSGCRWILAIMFAFIAAAFVLQLSPGGGMRGGGPGGSSEANNVLGKVGDFEITEDAIWGMANQSLGQYSQQLGGALPPSMTAMFVASATEQQVNAGALIEVAKQKGVDLGDDAVLAATNQAIDDEIMSRRQQLSDAKKLAPNASDAVFESVFKKEYGQDTKAFRSGVIEQYQQALKDPARRSQIVVSAANTLVMNKLMDGITASDDDVKSFYDQYMCRRIFLKQSAHVGEDLTKKANDIKAEIAKGLKFADAMDKYTDDPPAPKKAKHDNVFQVDGKTAALNEAYTPITKQKPGEVAGPYSLGDEGVSLVVLDSKTNQLPPDFEAKKETYRKDYKRDRAAGELQDALKKVRSADSIKWESPTYQVLYDMVTFDQSPEARGLDPKAKKAKYDDYLKRAEAAKEDPKGVRAYPLALYKAFDQIWSLSTDAEKAALTEKRIEVLSSILQTTENADLRLELADLLGAKKDGKGVTENLKLAASAIASDFGPTGQKVFSDVNGRLLKFKTAGIIDADQEKDVRATLTDWLKNKAESDKYEAEQKKQADDEKKKFEEEQKAQKAKDDKAKTPPAKTGK